MKRIFAVACAAMMAPPAVVLASVPAGAAEIQPHRAVYDVSLQATDPSVSLVSGTGRLVLEITGSICDGFSTTMRDVTRVTDREGTVQTTDQRVSSYETMDPPTFSFVNEIKVDGQQQSSLRGEATARASGINVEVREPKDTSFELRRGLFPVAHTLLLLDAAAEGERVLEAPLYPADESGDQVYDTTALIGPERTGLPGARAREVEALGVMEGANDMAVYRVTMSYFKQSDGAGEKVPETEMSYSLMSNGVAYNVLFDYGGFGLTARLAELELIDGPGC